MKDRFKFRVPYYKKYDNMFYGFEYTDFEKGVKQYNPDIEYHREYEQCTGLKDKNSKLIYEGDIIELYRGKSNIHQKKGKRFEVKFLTHRFCGFGFGYVDCPSVDMALTESKAKICKVIGNIHENPELLKE